MLTHRYLVRAHDGSSHDGTILPVANRPLIAGQAQALVGDAVFCPRCDGTFAILGWHAHQPLPKGQAAAAGMITACGAILHTQQRQQSLRVNFLAQAQQLIHEFAASESGPSAFAEPQPSQHTPPQPFAKAILIRQLQARLAHSADAPNLTTPSIQQGPSSLCGPACFAYCLLQDRPDRYVATIMALWQHGQAKLGDLHLRPSPQALNPKQFSQPNGQQTHLPMIDWILLASLKDSINKLLPYGSPRNKTAGITFWFHLDAWFRAVGAPKGHHYYAPLGSSPRQLSQLSQSVDARQHVIALIGAGMLQNGRGRFSNHWVVFTAAPIYAERPPKPHTLTRIRVFSWGRNAEQGQAKLTYCRLRQHLYGAWTYGQIP
ncbi:MAG: PAAR domain-containing protein [Neisseriaceae bacterium]|nr:PAAR domain-containing protein [Neisseriaceae bacterium]